MKINRKLFLIAAVIIFPAIALTQTVEAQSRRPQQEPVKVYDGRDASGLGEAFGVGEYRADREQLGYLSNDSASSVIVGRGYRVRLCENEGEGKAAGNCEEFGRGIHNLKYDNSASFIKVWFLSSDEVTESDEKGVWDSGGIAVYDQRDYKGNRQIFGTGIYRADRNELGKLANDKAVSIIVGEGYRVRLCEHEGEKGTGAGKCEQWSEGDYNLLYANQASFIEVERIKVKGR